MLIFVVLTAYHTVGGGALSHPYGDLVIFFVPPAFVIVGVAVLLIGMYIQWIRWRMYKPLSFGRYPKWDLNVPRERKALLSVAIGALIISVPAIYGTSQAYLYTDAVSFCGATCHSMTPEYVTYGLSPHARVSCAQCHVGPGATGYIESKIRGMLELVETIQNDFPRPIPIPVMALRPVRGNCEECHWPANFIGSLEVHREYYLSDQQNTRWEIDMSVPVGGGRPEDRTPLGIHWHVASKVEYIASDAERQNITWVRSVDARTGAAKVYTSQGHSPTSTGGAEIRTIDCVDCHNRPSHVLEAPTDSVNAALESGRIDATLPFVKQQGVAALAAAYTNREQAMQGIENALLGYYRKTYPAVYTDKQPAIQAAVAQLRTTYNRYFFPSMKVRWDTYYVNDGHLNFPGCFRCHDGQHKSTDGSAIRSGCGDCHTILRQGKAGSLEYAKGTREGLTFQHPVDIGDAWASQACNTCHTGGGM